MAVCTVAVCGCGDGDQGNDGFAWDNTPKTDAAAADVVEDDAAEDGGTEASEPPGPSECLVQADISDQLGGELFFGYPALGVDAVTLSCGDTLASRKEVAVQFTPTRSGEIVLSTHHPSTTAGTTIELRQSNCTGDVLGCAKDPGTSAPGARLTATVEAGTRYVAIVEGDEANTIFALGVHPKGVCEGHGSSSDVTANLLTGERFGASTTGSTSSLRGVCSAQGVDAPETRVRFTAPRTGAMSATAIHLNTTFSPLLYVRETTTKNASYCDSPEAEIGCVSGAAGGVLRFDVRQGDTYDLFVDGQSDGDSGAATLTLGYAYKSPAQQSLEGCNHTAFRDQYAVLLTAGKTVDVLADTVDAATAADLRLRCLSPDGSQLFEVDDDFACTYPPPKYSCPKKTFEVPTTGMYTLEVYVGTSQSCKDTSRVNYVIKAHEDGLPSDLILIKDQ